MPETPDTLAYMVLGYIAAGIIMGGTLLYLILKGRRVRNEIKMLKALEDEKKE